jgi:hypothetical protein
MGLVLLRGAACEDRETVLIVAGADLKHDGLPSRRHRGDAAGGGL